MASHGLKVAASRRNIETMPRPPSSKMPCKKISKTSRASSSKMNSIFRWVAAQRKVFTTPLLTEAKSDRNTKQFTKRNHVTKEAVSAAWQTKTRQRSERICTPNHAPRTMPWPCVKTMLCDGCTTERDTTCYPLRRESDQVQRIECAYSPVSGFADVSSG